MVRRNEFKKLKQILHSKNNLDFLWENNVKDKISIVHVAAKYNSLECLKYLVKRGGARALVLRDTSGWTALHYGSYMGHLYIVKYLLEHGSPILRDNKGKTPIFWSGRSAQYVTIIKLLIEATTNSAKGKGGKISSKNISASASSTNSNHHYKKIGKSSNNIGKKKHINSSSSGSSRASNNDSDSTINDDDDDDSDFVDMVEDDKYTTESEHKYINHLDGNKRSKNTNNSSSSTYNTINNNNNDNNSIDDGDNDEDDDNKDDDLFSTNGSFSNLSNSNNRAKIKNRRAIGRRSGNITTAFEEGSWDELHISLLNDKIENIEELLKDKNANNNKKNFVNKSGECGLTPLHISAMIRNQDVVQLILDNGANLEACDAGGKTPLHRAAQCGNTSTLRCLIKNGGNIFTTDNDGRNPLHDAAFNNHSEALELLLTFGGKVDLKDNDGNTGMLLACNQGNVDIVQILINYNANVNLSDLEGQTPLHDAIANKDTKTVETLLSSSKARVDLRNEYGRTALHSACAKNCFEIVEMLLNKVKYAKSVAYNDVLNARDEEGWSALHDAAATGAVDIVALLCENGIDINSSKSDMQRPLHCAAANGHVETVKYLLANGARANAGDSNGDTALHWAAFKGQAQSVFAILNAALNSDVRSPTDPHSQNADGGTALHSAANHGDVATGEILLEFGASVDVQMDDGNASLHNAAYEGHYDFALMLLEHDATVDIINAELRTPLHEAACMGHTHLCRLLLTYGAVIDLQDGGGDTPLHWSVCNGHATCAQFLLEQGSNMGTVNVDGGTPLHAALINNEFECIRVLLQAGANVNSKMEVAGERSGDSCLHVAAAEGLTSCITMLIEAGALINEKNAMGRTPLHEAIRRRHYKAAAILIENNADFSIPDNRNCVPLHYALGRRPDLLCPMAESIKTVTTLPVEWQGFSDMFDNDQFSDVVIETKEGQKINAHKIVLCCRCSPFRAMFSHSFKESNQHTVKLDYPYDVVKMLVQFLYSGTVEIDSVMPETAMECLQLADQYTLEKLKTLCGCILQKSLDIDNVVDVYIFAKFHGARNLQLSCIDYFLKPNTGKRIMDQYRMTRKASIMPKSNKGSNNCNSPEVIAPKKRYESIIKDILNRRWKTLGIKLIQKLPGKVKNNNNESIRNQIQQGNADAANNNNNINNNNNNIDGNIVVEEEDDEEVESELDDDDDDDDEIHQHNHIIVTNNESDDEELN